MRQPKTTEEFMALPVRSIVTYEEFEITYGNRAELEQRVGRPLLGRTIRFPKIQVGYVMQYEPDTVFFGRDINGDGYALAQDEDGYCRRPVQL